MSKLKGLLLNFSLLAFGIILSVGFLEVALRLVPQGNHKQWYDRPKAFYNPPLSKTLQAQTHVAEKPANVFRVAVVGDSFSFAPHMQFDDAFPKKLERMLNVNGGERRAEVVNYAVPAYSTTHEVELVKRAIAEHADLVLLQITLNDPEIKGYRPTGITVKQNPYGAYVEAEDAGWFAKRSRLASLVAGRIHNWKSHEKYKSYYQELYANQKATSAMQHALEQMVAMCREHNVPLVAVIFPLFGTAIDQSYPFTPQHEQLHEMAEKAGIKNHDLLELYRGIPSERLQVMPGEDFHPNEIGHRMAAEEIYRWLGAESLIPTELMIRDWYSQRDQILLKDDLKTTLSTEK